jgi:hypothetical protein
VSSPNCTKNHSLPAGNKSLESVAKFKYLKKKTVTNQNNIHKEIKGRLNPGIACYRSVQSLLPSHGPLRTSRLKYTKL